MNKMKRAIRWVIINAIFAVVLWSGFEQGVDGARRVVLFWIWLMTILSLCFLSSEIRQKTAEKGPSVPQWIDGLYDIAVIVFLVWHGCEVVASAYTFHSVLLHSAYKAGPAAVASQEKAHV